MSGFEVCRIDTSKAEVSLFRDGNKSIQVSISWRQRLYYRLPVWLQNVACTIEGRRMRRLRMGGAFARHLAELRESDRAPLAAIEEYQNRRLSLLVAHAYNTVPYYRRIFTERGIKPNDIRNRSDLAILPILTKEAVREHVEELISTAIDRTRLEIIHTSGSTGKALTLYTEREAVQLRWAVWWRHRSRFGVAVDAPFAVFTGKPAVRLDASHPPYWRENRTMRQTIFPMQQVVPEKIKAIAERLNEGKFVYYSGYPSILFSLAQMLEEQSVNIERPPKIIFTGAEKLYPHQRELMQKVFRCPVTDQYGFSEGCGNASRCECDRFHEDYEFCILECDRPEALGGRRIRGSILATGFASLAFPLLRYEVGDIGVWNEEPCPCGRHSRVLDEIEGRTEDYVVTPEGSRILRFDYIFKDTGNILEAQVIQERHDEIIIRLVQRTFFSVEDERLLRNGVATMVSPRLAVRIEVVERIERTATGKFRAVVSRMARAGQ